MSNLILKNTHLPYEHATRAPGDGQEALHLWVVTVPGAAMAFQAMSVSGMVDLSLFATDPLGTQWIASDLSLHRVASDGRPGCTWLNGQPCEFEAYPVGVTDNVMHCAVKERDRDLFIRRYLTTELEFWMGRS